jgi:uncharacterized protein
MAEAQMLLPIVTPDSAPFWNGCRNGQLLLQQCTACESWRYPPAPVCSRCGSLEERWSPVSRRGTIHSFVVYYRTFHPAYADDIPYAVALVDLDEGVRMAMRVVEYPVEALAIGMEGTIELRRVTEEIWVPVFVPTAKIPLREACGEQSRTTLPPLSKGE